MHWLMNCIYQNIPEKLECIKSPIEIMLATEQEHKSNHGIVSESNVRRKWLVIHLVEIT